MDDHRAELEIIERLHRKGIPLAIGLEMFTYGSQGVLDRWVTGKLDRDQFIRSYYREWAMPWPLYRDIFLYARKQGIPLVGFNVPREITRKVAREGFASLTPGELRQLPAGVSCSVDPVYRAFIRRAFAAHEESDDTFNHFCEAQMLWNMSMGMHLLEYSDRHPGTTPIVLAGDRTRNETGDTRRGLPALREELPGHPAGTSPTGPDHGDGQGCRLPGSSTASVSRRPAGSNEANKSDPSGHVGSWCPLSA